MRSTRAAAKESEDIVSPTPLRIRKLKRSNEITESAEDSDDDTADKNGPSLLPLTRAAAEEFEDNISPTPILRRVSGPRPMAASHLRIPRQLQERNFQSGDEQQLPETNKEPVPNRTTTEPNDVRAYRRKEKIGPSPALRRLFGGSRSASKMLPGRNARRARRHDEATRIGQAVSTVQKSSQSDVIASS